MCQNGITAVNHGTCLYVGRLTETISHIIVPLERENE